MTPLRDLLESIVSLTKIWKRDQALKPIETKLARQMAKAFRAHRAVFMAEFERLGPGILAEASTLPAIEGALEQLTRRHSPTSSPDRGGAGPRSLPPRSRVAEFGVSCVDLKNPRAVRAIRDRAAAAVTEIDATTRDEISRIVAKGMEEGYNYQKVARQIVAKYDEFGVGKPQAHIRNRAELIAVTEAAEAYETGNRLVIDEMTAVGLVMEMSWSTVGDARVSDGCIANAAVGWIPVDQLFPSGHQHPPRFPGCRCATLYRRRPTT